MPDEYSTIKKQLDAELEQLAEGVRIERRQAELVRVRPALYAIQNGLAADQEASCLERAAETSGATWVTDLISTEGAFAEKALSLEDAAKKAIAAKELNEAGKKLLMENVYLIETRTTPRILQFSRALAGIIGNRSFSASWVEPKLNFGVRINTEDNKYRIRIRKGYPKYGKHGLEKVSFIQEMDLRVKPREGKILLLDNRYEPRGDTDNYRIDEIITWDYFYGNWKLDRHMGRWGKNPKKVFKRIAENFRKNGYLDNTFLRMYTMVPDIILNASKEFHVMEETNFGYIEKETLGVMALAEGTR